MRMNTTGLLSKLRAKYNQRAPTKVDSKEVGLVLLHKLTGIKHLHYGFWDEDVKPSLRELPAAQERYAELLIQTLDDHLQQMELGKQESRLLDVGCGTGALLCEPQPPGLCHRCGRAVPIYAQGSAKSANSAPPKYQDRCKDLLVSF